MASVRVCSAALLLGLLAWLYMTIGARPLRQQSPRRSATSSIVARQLRWGEKVVTTQHRVALASVAASSLHAAATQHAAAPSPQQTMSSVQPAVQSDAARPLQPPRSDQCHTMPRTELHGDVVRWGSDFIVRSAAECCEACRTLARVVPPAKNCTVWVYCDQPACAAQRGQCWLKHLLDPFTDIDLVQGRSDRWTAGTMQPPPPVGSTAGRPTVAAADAQLALVSTFGSIRIKLREKSPMAKRWVESILANQPQCDGCTFYRAETVPMHWGSPDWPDTFEGGRWGPPYALLQGGLSARGAPAPRAPREDDPVVRRGMMAWAGGASGPAFFIALADHPEWGRGHTVFADVVPADMAIVEEIVRQPTRTNPGKIPITNLKTPVRFRLENLQQHLA